MRSTSPSSTTRSATRRTTCGSCKLGKYAESLKFFEDTMDLRIPLTKEVYSSLICSYVKQGKLTEAESTFSSMKEYGCFPDVLTYTTMIQAYNDDGSWRSAWDLFKEIEGNAIQPDAIICSSLMEALNKGSQLERVLQLMEFMKENHIPFNQKAYFEIIASCSMLRDWKTASEIIEHFDSSLSPISVGTLNHLLNFLGNCGKTDSMMKGTLNPYVGKQYVPIYGVSAAANTANEPFSQLSTSISGRGNGYVAVHGYNVPGNQYMQLTGSNFNNTSPTP